MRVLSNRGRRTVELPFLMSCALYLLDRRYWILGVRYPWKGIRYDLVGRDARFNDHVVLVEAKYRSDSRPIRPSEVEHFQRALDHAKSPDYNVRGLFMTNADFSQQALQTARLLRIQTLSHIPLLFVVNKNEHSAVQAHQV